MIRPRRTIWRFITRILQYRRTEEGASVMQLGNIREIKFHIEITFVLYNRGPSGFYWNIKQIISTVAGWAIPDGTVSFWQCLIAVFVTMLILQCFVVIEMYWQTITNFLDLQYIYYTYVFTSKDTYTFYV